MGSQMQSAIEGNLEEFGHRLSSLKSHFIFKAETYEKWMIPKISKMK